MGVPRLRGGPCRPPALPTQWSWTLPSVLIWALLGHLGVALSVSAHGQGGSARPCLPRTFWCQHRMSLAPPQSPTQAALSAEDCPGGPGSAPPTHRGPRKRPPVAQEVPHPPWSRKRPPQKHTWLSADFWPRLGKVVLDGAARGKGTCVLSRTSWAALSLMERWALGS